MSTSQPQIALDNFEFKYMYIQIHSFCKHLATLTLAQNAFFNCAIMRHGSLTTIDNDKRPALNSAV